ncbi:hypothetical protein [uncultured Dialister sp.]|uniref:hypothetical protein n=1 Tax=uncultured Dialister sp. TaxID=278064 RepID=UPI00261BDC92|nr:hypothetical protein [uncultured Dialister sp.]
MDDLSDFRFLGYQIVKITYHINDVKNPTEQTKLTHKILVSVSPENLDDGRTRLECNISASTMPVEDDVPGEAVFDLQIIMIGRFKGPKNISESDFKKFLNLNGVATLLPLLRGAVTSITQAINLPQPIVLPLFNVYNMPQNQNGEGQ